jgi:hypothetical protein
MQRRQINDKVRRGASAICQFWLRQPKILPMAKHSTARGQRGRHCITPLFVNEDTKSECAGRFVTHCMNRDLQ